MDIAGLYELECVQVAFREPVEPKWLNTVYVHVEVS